jgi:hypothetical protein
MASVSRFASKNTYGEVITGAYTTWANIPNCYADDGNYSTVFVNGQASGDGGSRYLHLAGFGFSIPAGSIIDGVEVEVEDKYSLGNGETYFSRQRLALIEADEYGGHPTSNVVGMIYSLSVSAGTSDTVRTGGGPSSLWERTLTPEVVNQENFGIQWAIGFEVDGPKDEIVGTYSLNYAKVTIHYTPPAANDTTKGFFALMR